MTSASGHEDEHRPICVTEGRRTSNEASTRTRHVSRLTPPLRGTRGETGPRALAKGALARRQGAGLRGEVEPFIHRPAEAVVELAEGVCVAPQRQLEVRRANGERRSVGMLA